VIDKGHAHLEAVRHRHHVKVAQQLRAQIQAALEPGHGGLRRFGRGGREKRTLDVLHLGDRVTPARALAQRGTGERGHLLGQKKPALHAVRLDEAAVGRRKMAPPRTQPCRHEDASQRSDGRPQRDPRAAWPTSARGKRVNEG
jgi:hypothetical protein